MSLIDTRYISFFKSGEFKLVPAQSHIERLKDGLKVRFTFQPGNAAEMEDIIADNQNGRVRMITANGQEFSHGPVFDQLYVWYDYIVKT